MTVWGLFAVPIPKEHMMNYSTYQALAPLYRWPLARGINPVALANPVWMAAWWARRDALHARVAELTAQGQFTWATAYLEANPVIPINEDAVGETIPGLVEVPNPYLSWGSIVSYDGF